MDLISKKMGYADFIKANFSKVLRAFYKTFRKKRTILVNLSFAPLYLIATTYLFNASLFGKTHLRPEHSVFLVFDVVFILLHVCLLGKEKKVYRQVFRKIQDLHTIYEIDEQQIRVKNSET